MSKHPAPPSYIEAFTFPTLDKYTSTREPNFHQAVVVLVPYRGNEAFDWTVLAGFHAVAEALVEAEVAHNMSLVESRIEDWISKAQGAIAADHDWHQGWARSLAANPAITRALERGPEELFDRAGLTVPQRIAMRLRMRDDRSGREIAIELRISESAFRDRIERAAIAILNLSSNAQTELKTSA
jgi:hypothetical protein